MKIDGFQQEPFDPAIAAIIDDSASGEHPLVVVNVNQPHKNAVQAIRTIRLQSLAWLPTLLHLMEPLRRAPAESIMMATATGIAAVVGSLTLMLGAEQPPPPAPFATHVYIPDERKPLARVVRPWSNPERVRSATERRTPTRTRSPRTRSSPTRPSVPPRAHPTRTPAAEPSQIVIISPPS